LFFYLDYNENNSVTKKISKSYFEIDIFLELQFGRQLYFQKISSNQKLTSTPPFFITHASYQHRRTLTPLPPLSFIPLPTVQRSFLLASILFRFF